MTNGTMDYGNMSMLDLFRVEVEGQSATLSECLLQLEQTPADPQCLERLMRAAHSVKGAARMVDIDIGVQLAHAMEDCFVTAQQGSITLGSTQIDCLLKGVDALKAIANAPAEDFSAWLASAQGEFEPLIGELAELRTSTICSAMRSTVRSRHSLKIC
jgi:two-component system sensor histidine kinase and response regulator WspE